MNGFLNLESSSFLDMMSSPLVVATYLFVLILAIIFLIIAALRAAFSSRARVISLVAKGSVAPAQQPAVQQPAATAAQPSAAAPAKAAPAQRPASGTSTVKRSGDQPRFSALAEIDRRMAHYRAPTFDRTISLASFCDALRMYAADKQKLYYGIDDIRSFVASLGVSRILIMQGMSGTGKTSLASVFGNFVGHDSKIIPIQPMWKERSDMIGYFNEFTDRFNEGELLQQLYEASYSSEIYITVLDEMNIARVEYYFADFLSLLELPDTKDRKLEVVSDKWPNDPMRLTDGKLIIPDNVWFIGTANNDDSTFAISDKVYDRAMIINLDKKADPFVPAATPGVTVSYHYFRLLVARALDEYALSRRTKRKLQALDEYMIEHFHITFGNRIKKQISQYVPLYIACGGEELEALDDIFAKKVLRKLEAQNPIYVRNATEGLLSKLDELFGADTMPICKAYLHKLQYSL